MAIYILFGLPGAGKTFVGNIMKNDFGFYFHDGDADLPMDMKEAINKQASISVAMRDNFFERILAHVKQLQKEHKKIVLSQTFIDEKYRKLFLHELAGVQFFLIEAKTDIREKRLHKRTYYPLGSDYAKDMVVHFEKPTITYKIITNDTDGEEGIKKQLTQLLS